MPAGEGPWGRNTVSFLVKKQSSTGAGLTSALPPGKMASEYRGPASAMVRASYQAARLRRTVPGRDGNRERDGKGLREPDLEL
jgi:hypothetical protein